MPYRSDPMRNVNDEPFWGYDGPQPEPCSPQAMELAEAMENLFDATVELNKVNDSLRDRYSAQWTDEEMNARARQDYYRAAERLVRAIKAL